MTSNVVLTLDQEEAVVKFKSFLLNPNEKYFHIFGAAGCGKTFLLQYLINHVFNDYKNMCKVLSIEPVKYETIYLTAPTNKAVEVLDGFSKMITFNKVPIAVETIYKLFNLKVSEDYSTGETSISYPLKIEDIPTSIIVIDECSMLPQEILKLLEEHTPNSKVIFVGDSYQLAPVNQKPYWELKNDPNIAYLSVPVRNSNSKVLINLCDQLRTTVKDLNFKPIVLCPNTIELLDDEKVADWLLHADYSKSRVLCYTNAKAIKYIKWLEDAKQNPKFIRANQIYINNGSFFPYKKKSIFYPDQMVRILQIENDSYISKSPNDKFFLVTSKILVSPLNNSRYVSEAFVAKDPYELKSKISLAAKQKDWISYFWLKQNIMDLRLPYASTIHKSQGSTFEEVLIDLGSFRVCDNPEIAARLLYVAASRARSKIYFYGKLPKKYGVLV